MLKINDLMLGGEATMEDVYKAVKWLNDHGYECGATGDCGLVNQGIDEDDMIPDNVWQQMLDEIYSPARISVDNGHTFVPPSEALSTVNIETMANYMDDDTREAVHAEIAPCTDAEFLAAYLERAADDLIVG